MSLSSKQWLGSVLGLGSLLSLGSHVVLPHDALAHPIGIPSGQTLFSITESAQASQPTLIAQAIGVSGVWDTSEGQMTIQQQGSFVTATYTQDNGRIEGTLIGNVWEGFWSEDGSAQRCDTPINGRYHWGRIRFVFDGNAFQGTWSYCNDEPTRSWTGNRTSGVSINPPSLPAPSFNLSGTWDTSEGIMPLTLNGSTVTGYYSNETQRIDGTLVGNTLEGYWSKDSSAQRCDTAYNGRSYWGRIRFVFNGNSFVGVWGYCGEEPTRSWTGTNTGSSGVVRIPPIFDPPSNPSVSPVNPPVVVAPLAISIGGGWDTSEGQMTFQQQGSSVTATYTQDNGRIEGTMTGNVLEGYWSEDGSAQRCDTAINGRYHWGQIRFVFNGDAFEGVWSYCGEEPTRPWTGTRLSGGGGSVVTPIAPTLSVGIAGAWNTSWGIMPLTLNGSTVTGYYSNETQRIDGTLVGNTLDGYWSKDSAGQRCDTPYNDGRYYWGRIRFVFEGNSFQGVWGYCGEEPTRSWTGNR